MTYQHEMRTYAMSDADRLLLMSALAVKEPLTELLTELATTSGLAIETVFDPTAVIEKAIAGGSRPDLVVCIDAAMGRLVEQSVIEGSSVRVLAESSIGVAIAPGVPAPDIGSVEELIAALLGARAVAYSRTGASGQSFAKLIDRLGIADRVNARAVVIEKGFVAETLLDGRADLAIQQLSELAVVDGVDIVGPLPDGAQDRVVLSVGIGIGRADDPAVRRVYEALVSSRMAERLVAAHLEPPLRSSLQ
jgi:molybdate transport system substrate-binding protein